MICIKWSYLIHFLRLNSFYFYVQKKLSLKRQLLRERVIYLIRVPYLSVLPAGFGTVKLPVAKVSRGQNPPPFLISYYVIGSYYIVYFSWLSNLFLNIYASAITSISISASSGNFATWKALLAGKSLEKNVA